MLASLAPLLFASAVSAVVLPKGASVNSDNGIGELLDRGFNDTLIHALEGRGTFGPISTGSPAGIAGGQAACGSPPLSSFFAGLKPPV